MLSLPGWLKMVYPYTVAYLVPTGLDVFVQKTCALLLPAG